MPRRKIPITFVEDRQARAAAYRRRAKGIKKKADELATMCGVRVALVCDGGASGVKPFNWQSKEGVLDTYRAVPPKIRAQHTLRNHLESELCKVSAKLARVQQQGPALLSGVGAALGDMSPAKVQELLESSVSATRKRLVALGLPADGKLQQIAADAVVMEPQLGHGGLPCIGSNAGDMDAGFQLQTVPCPGLEESSWDNGFQQRHNAETMQPAYGFQQTGENYLGDVHSYGQMQEPGYGNYGYGYPDLTMCYDESCNGVLPAEYYYPSLGMSVGGHFIHGTPAPDQPAIFSGNGGDYINAAPHGYDMGIGGNFTSPESYTGYWCPAQDYFQHGHAGSSTSHSQEAASPQCPAPVTGSSTKVFRYPQLD
jgi:hypothetical protein